jgi:hypothetical protein
MSESLSAVPARRRHSDKRCGHVTTPSKDIVPNYGMGLLSTSPATRGRRGFPARRWKSLSKTR